MLGVESSMSKMDTLQEFLPCLYEKRGTESPSFVGSIPYGGELRANSERAGRSALAASQSLGRCQLGRFRSWFLGKSLVKTPRATFRKTSAQAEKCGRPWWDQWLAPRILAVQGMGQPPSDYQGEEPAPPRKGRRPNR